MQFLFAKGLESEHVHFMSDFVKSEIRHWNQSISQVKLHLNTTFSEKLNNTNGQPVLSWETNHCKSHFKPVPSSSGALRPTGRLKAVISHQCHINISFGHIDVCLSPKFSSGLINPKLGSANRSFEFSQKYTTINHH